MLVSGTGVFLTIRFFLLPWPRWTIASVSCFMFPRDQVEERKDYERGAGERCKKKKHKPKDNNENLGTLSDVCFSWADVNVSRFFISFGILFEPLGGSFGNSFCLLSARRRHLNSIIFSTFNKIRKMMHGN